MTNNPEVIRAQGRVLSAVEFRQLQQRIDQHPEWSRQRIARELCQQWNWRTVGGQLKTFAAREFLLKLERRYELHLPPVREQYRQRAWGIKSDGPPKASLATALECPLEEVQPLSWQICSYGTDRREHALGLLRQYHYLGCNRPVGTHLLYLVQDRQGRDLAVHLMGAAAWQCAPRETYVGWSGEQRARALLAVVNHSRFLILPGVRVPHLASHLLRELPRRLPEDWRQHHGGRVLLLESFVERGRFVGTAYRAAGWQEVGQTTGRTRQEKGHGATAAPKSVWLYPLREDFRQQLANGGAQ